MTQVCRPAKCVEAVRVTLLDQCTLEPLAGPLNGYAVGCIIDASWTPEIEEGEESVLKDNCGNICHRDDRCDQAKRWGIEFKIANPDPELISLLMGDPLVVEGATSIGVRHLAHGCSPYLFVELFERTDECDDDGEAVYLRHVFPAARLKWTGNEREGIFRLLQIEGKTKAVLTDSIGTGPYLDIPVGLIVGATPAEQTDYVWFEDVTAPVVQCGAITVGLAGCDPEAGVEATDVSFPADFTIQIDGSGFDNVSAIQSNLATWWSPASGFPSVNGSVISWTDTQIVLDLDPDQGSGWFLESLNFYCVNPPDVALVETYVVNEEVPTSDPEVLSVNGSACWGFGLDGNYFHQVNHMQLIGTFGTLDFYDPAGPDAGLNVFPGEFVQWDTTQIFASHPALGNETVTAVHLWGVGDAPDYGIYDVADTLIGACAMQERYVCADDTMKLVGNDFLTSQTVEIDTDGDNIADATLVAGVDYTIVDDNVIEFNSPLQSFIGPATIIYLITVYDGLANQLGQHGYGPPLDVTPCP